MISHLQGECSTTELTGLAQQFLDILLNYCVILPILLHQQLVNVSVTMQWECAYGIYPRNMWIQWLVPFLLLHCVSDISFALTNGKQDEF